MLTPEMSQRCHGQQNQFLLAANFLHLEGHTTTVFAIDESGGRFVGLESIPLDDISEREFEKLIKENERFLSEDLIIIGEQESFPEVGGDAVDLVALDKEGAVVVIEIKRGRTPSDVDFQALKYAAYLATLSPEELAQRATRFFEEEENRSLRKHLADLGLEMGEGDIDLASLLYQRFGAETEYKHETYQERLNSTQRIIILAEDFDTRIGMVITWLADVGIDIRGMQYTQFRMGKKRLFQVIQVIPPLKREWNIRRPPDREWKRDPIGWHLEHNCSPETAERLQELISEIPEAKVEWGQKLYIWLRGKERKVKIFTCYKSRFDLLFRRADRGYMEDLLSSSGAHPEIQESYNYDDSYDYIQIYPSSEIKGSALLTAFRAFLLEE